MIMKYFFLLFIVIAFIVLANSAPDQWEKQLAQITMLTMEEKATDTDLETAEKIEGVEETKGVNQPSPSLVLPSQTNYVPQETISLPETPTVSPFTKKVQIASISDKSIVLKTSLKEEERVNITGWKLKAGKGSETTIPQGIEIYPGYAAPTEDIYIKKNDRIYVQSSSIILSPNTAFRPNKCFGYLRDDYGSSFPFSSSKICPKIDKEELCGFSEVCRSYILKLQNCNPGRSYLTDLRLTSDPSCRAYIDNYISDNLSYEKCVAHYFMDDNFLKDSWYIYAGHCILCRCGKDTIYLYDQNGLLVDEYDYQRY